MPAFQDVKDFDTPLSAGENVAFVNLTGFNQPGLLIETLGADPTTSFYREAPAKDTLAPEFSAISKFHFSVHYGLTGVTSILI